MPAALTLRVLGSGTAFNTDGRGCQSLVLEPESGGTVLLDFGPDTMRAIAAYRVDASRIDTLFVTHLHGDHIAGWPFLLLHWLFVQPRTRPIDVFGPEGTEERLEGLSRLAYRELLSRRAFPIRYHELDRGQETAGDTPAGLRFETLPMVHHDTSLGYRLSVDGRRLALSGDTAWCENLVRLSRGTDAAIVECTSVDPVPGSHLSLAELRARSSELKTGRLVLVHLTDAVARSLAADPIPGAIATYDGLAIDL